MLTREEIIKFINILNKGKIVNFKKIFNNILKYTSGLPKK